MAEAAFDHDELARLIGVARDELLTPEELARLESILRDSHAARQFYVRCLTIHGLLEQGAVATALPVGGSSAEPSRRTGVRRRWLARSLPAAAAAMLMGLTLWWALANWPGLNPLRRARDVAWSVVPTGAARFTRLAPTVIRLERGELRLRRTGREADAADARPMSVETTAGTVTLTDADVLIGALESNPNLEPGEATMKAFTRVLVLAGVATLANAHGSVTGEADNLLAAQADQAPTRLVVEANTGFAVDLYRQLTRERPIENLFLSPYSIAIALAMAAEGARGATAEEMGNVLHFPKTARRVGADAQLIPWQTSLIHAGQARLQRDLVGAAKDKNLFELRIANALWGERTYPFRPQYVETIKNSYDVGAVMPADFIHQFEPERLRINGWVAERTKGKIEDLLPPGALSKLTRLVIANAIYFKGDWQQKFDKRATKDDAFTTLAGAKVKTPMMFGEFNQAKFAFIGKGDPAASLAQGSADNFRLLELPYKGGLSMVLIAPDQPRGLPALEAQLTEANLAGWLRQLRGYKKVEVRMPRFKFAMAFSLPATLKKLGMVRAFREPGPDGADFSGMSGSEPLYLTEVVHKAFVAVNEEGTEAAAATGIVVGLGGPPPAPAPQFFADRPFVFLIREPRSGAILFLGRVADASGIANQDPSESTARNLELARTAPTKHPLYQKLKSAAGVAVVRAYRDPSGEMEFKGDNAGRALYECSTILSLKGELKTGARSWLTFDNLAAASEVGQEFTDFFRPNYTKMTVLAIYDRELGRSVVRELLDFDEEARLIVAALFGVPPAKLKAAAHP